MIVSCLICQDVFTPDSEVESVVCGHLFHTACIYQWMERSKSCPQCRQKISAKTIHRIYFNISKTINEKEDPTILLNKVDSLSFDLRLKKKELETISNKNEAMTKANAGLRVLVSETEGKVRKLESTIIAMKDQVKQTKELSRQLLEAEDCKLILRKKLETLERVQSVMKCSAEETSKLLLGCQDVRGMATMIVMLKREVKEGIFKKERIRKRLVSSESSLKETSKKLNALEEMIKNSDFVKKSEEEKTETENINIESENSVVEISPNNSKKYVLRKSNTQLDSAPSPSVDEKVSQICNSESPYLQIQSSSVGGINALKFKLHPDKQRSLGIKYSIFAKQPAHGCASTSSKYKVSGMGGFSEIEEFPVRKPNNLKRPSVVPCQRKKKLLKPDPSVKLINNYLEILSD